MKACNILNALSVYPWGCHERSIWRNRQSVLWKCKHLNGLPCSLFPIQALSVTFLMFPTNKINQVKLEMFVDINVCAIDFRIILLYSPLQCHV